MAKLINVPMSTYSVCFLAPLESLKRSIDFAAIKNPIAEKLLDKTKVNTKIRSKIPM